jgi:hypothetical protein
MAIGTMPGGSATACARSQQASCCSRCRPPARHRGQDSPRRAPILRGRSTGRSAPLGTWRGVRRDAADGSEGAMTMRVAPILGGAGQTREMEIAHAGGLYRGFAVQVYDPEGRCWLRRYVNDVRRRFSELEGEVDGERSEWRSVSPGRTRESRLASERPAPDRWVRTMSISEDGGTTWRELWIDELTRVDR